MWIIRLVSGTKLPSTATNTFVPMMMITATKWIANVKHTRRNVDVTHTAVMGRINTSALTPTVRVDMAMDTGSATKSNTATVINARSVRSVIRRRNVIRSATSAIIIS